MLWAAIQDWMCEPWILEKTGLTLDEHQRRTIESLRVLRELAPEIPWAPVVQGWAVADYLWHVEMYRDAGFDLTLEPIVGRWLRLPTPGHARGRGDHAGPVCAWPSHPRLWD